MKLSVIIPAYNEEAYIATVLERVRAVAIPKEIIVVDDGSKDATAAIVQRQAGEDLTLVRHGQNRGKGAAIRTGLMRASGEVVIIQDADLEYDPQDYHAVVGPIMRGQARVVYGSRVLKPANRYSYLSFYWGGRLVSLATNLLYGSRLTDEPTCYKAFETPLLKSLDLACTGFEFCPEVTGKLLKRGVAIHEVPISYTPRNKGQGKKITFLDGLEAIWVLVKIKLGGRG
ncbi:MAG: glycosyltransferase family 2 protein [Desulfarculus sp.]|nr:glycosyltransferase family 2 protein [Desulfarculus sp.]